jgi:hypothetical protein
LVTRVTIERLFCPRYFFAYVVMSFGVSLSMVASSRSAPSTLPVGAV